jgi:hypothetical protein
VVEDHLFDAFHREPAAGGLGIGEHRPHLLEVALHVSGVGLGIDGDAFERGAGEDDRVPVVAGGACDELAAFLAGEVLG